MKFNLLDAPQNPRFWVLLVLYTAELTASLWFSYELRFDFHIEPSAERERWITLLWIVPMQLTLLWIFRQLTPLLGYFSTPDLYRMFYALSIGTAISLAAWWMGGAGVAPPRGVIVTHFILSLVGLTGVRLALRTFRETASAPRGAPNQRLRKVGILGAGDAGAVLVHELSLKPGYGLDPVAFFDDDSSKWKSRVHGVPVVGPPERLAELAQEQGIREAIIAMPSAPPKRIGELVQLLRDAGVTCRTVPSLDQLALGQVKVSQLRNVEVQDLLGREKVELDMREIRVALEERVILVTGAGGSIGSELCRQIAAYHPSRLVLLERSEPSAFLIEQELIRNGHGDRLTTIVADVLDRNRVRQVFREHRPAVVFHAAAHKHVPLMESQPGEAVQNNTLGTLNVAEISIEAGVDRFILISTDKAINPTSVMGATKRLAEICIQGLHADQPNRTRFMAVRFGNVLGSSGSVIPTFQRQIAEGGPVKVTHPDMTRYFMTIPEAVMLVLQSAVLGKGGEIFVLDMGKPVKIVELARNMIELSGLKPDVDIEIEFIGLRPGEKLYEEISREQEHMVPTTHEKILRFTAPPVPMARLRAMLDRLTPVLFSAPAHELKRQLNEIIPEYTPFLHPSQVSSQDIPKHNTAPDSHATSMAIGLSSTKQTE